MANISQIKLPDNIGYDLRASAIPYGIVDATSTSTAFTVSVPGITALEDGVICMLKNGVVTSASGFTINVNGLGAKPVYNNMAAATADTTIFNVNYTMIFVYDSTRVSGGCWICYRGYNSDNNTVGYQLRTNSTALPTVTRTRYYRLLFTSADNTHWVPANTGYDNSATSQKTVNQNPINPFGRIVYMTGTTNVNAEANVGATVVWDQYALTLGYSFNNSGAALTLTYPAPVYVKCTPQANGSAIMDSTTPIVQALPSTEDGKIYIFLGIAYSATAIELIPNHPVYYYKDNAIRLWSDAFIPSTTGSSTTGITVSDHSTGSVIGVQSTTTSVTGVQSTTTTASKVTLGTAISIPNVTGASDVTVPIRADSDTTVPKAASSATTVPIKNASATAIPVVSGNASTTLSFTMDTTDTKKLVISWSNDAPTKTTFGTSASIYGVQSSTTSVTGVSGSTTVRGVKTGTSSTTTASKVTLGTAKSVPNVTDVSDVTVPIKNESATTVPIKDTSATTVVTSKTHTVNDSGHTHTI